MTPLLFTTTTTTILLLLLLLTHLPPTTADFLIYSGLESQFIPEQLTATFPYFVFSGKPSCADLRGAQGYWPNDDVSKNKQGVRCKGPLLEPPPADQVDQFELNSGEEHFTIYKADQFHFFGTDGRDLGRCEPKSCRDDDVGGCTTQINVRSGCMMWHCHSYMTAKDINWNGSNSGDDGVEEDEDEDEDQEEE
ncbi:hypothetical protein P280DRAFT_511095 [Massarina eburnea CBS 473.64]|uniref:Uncharacterized protein n=1 Tax=Massarina eburnea CBS 473.64 TaxID=1395130 RepID=A0A6A6RKL8_9PLEO|nr:hypothetical protein P280DRAFT_511095 [Massarina eburnea CBS 473.64]